MEMGDSDALVKVKVTTENLLTKIGSFGRYQVFLLVLVIYAILSWNVFIGQSKFFLTAEPRWKCVDDSTACNLTGTLGPGENNYEFRCGIPRQDWKFVDDISSIVTEFDLVCKKSIYASHVLVLSPAGGAVGAIVMGIASDRFGRKTVLFLSGLIATSSQLICVFSQDVMMFAVALFIVGIALPGTSGSAFVLITEYVGIKHRAVVGNSIWFSFSIGYMILAGVGYLVRDWRMFSLILVLCGVPVFLTYWISPESLRWLLVKKKDQDALKTLKKIARINKKSLEDNVELPAVEEERKAHLGDVRALFRSGYAKTTLVVWYCMFVNAMVYSGVHMSAPLVGGNLYFNWFLTGISESISIACAIYVHNRFGRKNSIVISMIAAALSAMGSVVLTLYNDGTTGFYVGNILMSMVLAKFFITISFNGIFLMITELYPTVIRNVAQGTGVAWLCIGEIISAYIVHLTRVHPLLPYGIMGVNAFVSGLLCLTLKETKDQPILENLPGHKTAENIEL